jgi:excisionase family DNA binding protein
MGVLHSIMPWRTLISGPWKKSIAIFSKGAPMNENHESPHSTRFMSTNETCEIFRISRSTFARLMKAGKIPHTKIGRRVLVPFSWIKDIEASAVSSRQPL